MQDIKAAILAAKLRIEPCELMGIACWIRRMSGLEREHFMKSASKASDDKDVYGLDRQLLSLTLCDQDGKLLFGSADDLGSVDGGEIHLLASRSAELNGIGEQGRKDAEKNSSTANGGSGPSSQTASIAP
jgi:hypothetical protein